MSIEVSRALDYSPKEISSGSYVLRLVNPENGQPTLSLNSTTNTDFLLPNQVFNLARSYLNFNYTIPALALNWHHAHSGFLAPIDGIVLSTASGVRLVEMNNLPEYTKIAWRPQTDYQEFLTFPCHSNSEATVGAVTQPGQLFNRIRAASSKLDDAAYVASSFHVATNNGLEINAAANDQNVAAADDYNAVANYIASPTAETALAVRVQLPLKMIYGSLLAVDKDLYFGEQLRLTIRWNQGTKWGWTSATSSFEGTAATADLAAAQLPSLTTVQLRVAVEVNDAIAQGLKSKVMGEGLNLNVPFTFVYKAVGSATASDVTTVIRKLNRGHGAKLLRVLAGLYTSSQTGNIYCNNYNYFTAGGVVPTKWLSYRTMLDSKPIQDDTLLMSDMSAYQYHAEKLKGSVIKDFKDWAQCPTIIEDFSGVINAKDYPENDTANSGLDLTTEREFAFQYTNTSAGGAQGAAALNVYLFCICQKKLHIGKDGVQLM